MDKKIDKIGYKEKKSKSIIKKFLLQKPQVASIKEIVLATGLPNDWIEYTLRLLMSDYPCQVKFNEEKELIYLFDFPPAGKFVREYLLRVFYLLIFLPIWVFVILYLIFMGFNLPVLILIRYPFRYLFYFLTFIFMLFVGLLAFFFPKIKAFFEEPIKKIYAHEKEMKEIDIMMAFVAFLFDGSWSLFKQIFQAGKKDILKIEKTLLDLINRNNGKITASDIAFITGWDLQKAQQEVTQLMANYDGEVVLSDSGVIVYQFEDLKTPSQEAIFEFADFYLTPQKLHQSELDFLDFLRIMSVYYLVTLALPLGYFLYLNSLAHEPDKFWIFIYPFIAIAAPFFLVLAVILIRMLVIYFQNKLIYQINQGFDIVNRIFRILPEKVYKQQFSEIKNIDSLNRKIILLGGETVFG